jgi:hypothetical protein
MLIRYATGWYMCVQEVLTGTCRYMVQPVVTSFLHSVTTGCTMLPLLCTLLLLVVLHYLYYALCYHWLYVTSIMNYVTAHCMLHLLCTLVPLVVCSLFYIANKDVKDLVLIRVGLCRGSLNFSEFSQCLYR